MPANVSITQDTTNPFSESDISINPYNLQQIIAGSNANNGTTQAQYWSNDGGVTWNQVSLPSVGSDAFQSDPAVAWTSDGSAWALTIGVNTSTGALVVRSFKSTDGGKTWTSDSTVSGSQTATDKPSLWVDRSTTSRKDNMYAVWHLNAQCFVSTRKGPGGSWQTPVQVSGSETTFTADGGDVKTNSAGDVFAFWPDAGGQTLRVAKSTDGGSTFTALGATPVKIASTFGSFTIKVPAQDARLTGGGGTIGCLIYVTGGAYKTAAEDLVFAVWHDLAGGTGCNAPGNAPGASVTSACKTRIWFSRSADGGSTWSTPVKINDQSSKNDQFFPRFAVDDTTGNLMVVYYDTVNDTNRVKTDIWMQNSTDGGLTWSPAVQVTTAETNEATGAEDNSQQYGDYIGLSGYGGRFFACWTDRRGGSDEQIFGAALAVPSLEFKIDKDTFGKNEVAAKSSYSPAYWLQVDGFTNESLGFNSPADLNSPPSPAPSITASINAALNPTLTAAQIASIAASLGANVPSVNQLQPLPILATDPTLAQEMQPFLYPYAISFANGSVFSTLNQHQFAYVTLSATLTVGAITVTTQATIELAAGEDPYFTDINPLAPTAFPAWLSFDLRFFKVTPTQSHQMFSVANPTSAGDAVTYIRNVLNHLNNPSLITNGDTFEGTLAQDESSSALEFLPKDTGGNPTFNFAVARVRLLSSIVTTISPVRVFFRLFQAASTASNFVEVGTAEGAYRWGSDGTPGHKIPLFGVGTDQNGNLEYVTIPCFATDRVNLTGPADMNTQHDDPNAASITTVANMEVDTYFGCWLDLNQQGGAANIFPSAPPAAQSQWDGPWPGTTSVNGLITASPHQCLIAEIRYDDTPIPTNATYATSDKLAQRNIAWIDGPNPGVDPSRVMPHPFEVRASDAAVAKADELMITWGSTPFNSTANIYLPAVPASTVLGLANAMYSAHRLTALDSHTIQCPANGVALVPVPKGVGRFAGLLSITLPLGIKRGEIFDVVVRQFSQATVQAQTPPPPPKISVAPASSVVTHKRISWQNALGAFQYNLVISLKEQLLYPEERLLAWLKWRIGVTPHRNRWYPVFLQYLKLIEGRVKGFGGDPGKIPPSPVGHVPGHPGHGLGGPPHHGGKDRLCHSGKVADIFYDRFGDFEGFSLLTEDGRELWFRGCEPQMEALIRRAWVDRFLITVFAEEHQPHLPSSVVLRRP